MNKPKRARTHTSAKQKKRKDVVRRRLPSTHPKGGNRAEAAAYISSHHPRKTLAAARGVHRRTHTHKRILLHARTCVHARESSPTPRRRLKTRGMTRARRKGRRMPRQSRQRSMPGRQPACVTRTITGRRRTRDAHRHARSVHGSMSRWSRVSCRLLRSSTFFYFHIFFNDTFLS